MSSNASFEEGGRPHILKNSLINKASVIDLEIIWHTYFIRCDSLIINLLF